MNCLRTLLSFIVLDTLTVGMPAHPEQLARSLRHIVATSIHFSSLYRDLRPSRRTEKMARPSHYAFTLCTLCREQRIYNTHL